MSNVLPGDFSASGFLYLNPGAIALSDVLSVEDAVERYALDFDGLPYTLPSPAMRSDFSSDVYLAEHRGYEIDVSSLNALINAADVKLGRHDTSGVYVPNLYTRIVVEDTDVFKVSSGLIVAEDLELSPCNIIAGDELKILKNDGRVVMYADVIEVMDESRFRVKSKTGYTFLEGDDAEYLAFGIKVSDKDRIAHINFTRRYGEGGVAEGLESEIPTSSAGGKPFNVDLYNMMYPDARFLTKEEAFVSYRNNWVNNDFRISKADDIVNINSPILMLDAVALQEQLELTGNLYWNGRKLVDVRDDAVSSYESTPKDTLITEYAIKKYVDVMFSEAATFGDIAVRGDGVVDGRLDVADNMTVTESNVSIQSDVGCHSTIRGNVVHAAMGLAVGGDGENAFPAWELEDAHPYLKGASIEDRIYLGANEDWFLHADTLNEGGIRRLSFVNANDGIEETPLVALERESSVGGVRGRRMVVDGDIFAKGTVLSLSDATEKSDICCMEGPDVICRLAKLKGYTYRGGMGLLAQEVRSVFPAAVQTFENGRTLSVSYGGLVGALVEGINELAGRIEEVRSLVISHTNT